MSQFVNIKPKVIRESEFLEIASDFGDPLEVIREAISNAYDANANLLIIDVTIDNTNGYDNLIITFIDNGDGMSEDRLVNNFWNLGDSHSKKFEDKIGEKGHGTKIYLRADSIDVKTSDGNNAFHSICENPFRSLSKGLMHSPKFKKIDAVSIERGTRICLEGYSKEFSRYRQDIVKDYIYWFTKHGSVEGQFKDDIRNFKINLSALDYKDGEYEELEFGHIFAEENSNINKLFNTHESNAADFFVKKYIWKDQSLERFPHIKYDVVINVEGDSAKRQYNPMISSRKSKETGKYKVSDRYGLWLCKDHIPIQRVNDWISNFGLGSNSVVMLHGFINCQYFKLTANRGTIANTNIEHIESLKNEIQKLLEEINEDLYKKELYTLKEWQVEAKTMKVEEIEFNRRRESITTRKSVTINNIKVLEPTNEAELVLLFNTLYNFYPEKFDFEPLDYNTNVGIDILARNKSTAKITDSEFWYVEVKNILSSSDFNHSFLNLRKVICWDFGKDIKDGTLITSKVDSQDRIFKFIDKCGKRKYFLDSDDSQIKIGVIRLKEFIKDEFGLEFEEQ